MKNPSKEHFGKEANTEYARRGIPYQEWTELAPQRPTFGEENKSGRKNAGFGKTWSEATKKVSKQGDSKTGPVTPVSGGEDGDTVDPKDRSQYLYVSGGKKYSAEFNRVPDAGKGWEATPFLDANGDPALYPNELAPLPANLKPAGANIGWKKRYALALDSQVGGPATAPNTPQRRKQRKTESK